MNKPLISIITVCFNSIKTIKQTIEGVLSQTYDNYEHIFIDGGSTDGTTELIKSYQQEYGNRLVLHVGKDKGIYDAMNKGIQLAHGQIIGIINSDDWYDTSALAEVARTYQEANNEMIVITGNLVRTTYTGEFLYLQKHDKSSITLAKLVEGMPLQHPAVFVAKKVYEEIGSFDISYRYLADYDFIWRCFDSGKVAFAFTGTTTSYMREGGASDTFKFKNIKERTQERYRLRQKYIGKPRAAITSGKFFATEIAKQSVKRILPESVKDKYYNAKHGMNGSEKENYTGEQAKSIERVSHNPIQIINDKLRDYPFIRERIILVIRYSQYGVASVKRAVKGAQDGILTSGKRLTPQNENCYFGYYDKSPYSTDGKFLVYHSIPAMRAPQMGEKAKIYLQNTENGERKCLGTTLAWNLQQGAMLRFYDESTVAWNDYRNGEYCTVLHSLKNEKENVIPWPLYDVDKSGEKGLTLEFERLNVDAEGYGYIQQGKNRFDTPATISIVDIKGKKIRKIVDSKMLNERYPISHPNVEFFYFNHLNFNPSGTRFLFIERYVYEHKRYSRLFSADLNGENIHLLASETMVSHFTWRTDEEIMVYCRHNGKDAYYILKDENEAKFNEVMNSHLHVDGHPTFLLGTTMKFVSDTYPDHGRRRHLFTYDMGSDEYKELASLKAPIKYDGPVRCDLHPRLHPNGKFVVIDSIHEGYRGIYEIEL